MELFRASVPKLYVVDDVVRHPSLMVQVNVSHGYVMVEDSDGSGSSLLAGAISGVSVPKLCLSLIDIHLSY